MSSLQESVWKAAYPISTSPWAPGSALLPTYRLGLLVVEFEPLKTRRTRSVFDQVFVELEVDTD